MLSAGKLDRRITLQVPIVTRGALGGVAETWADLATVWADIRPLSGKEIQMAQQTQTQAQMVMTIRHRSDLQANCRVLLEDANTFGNWYDFFFKAGTEKVARITWIAEIGRRQGLNLYCEVING